MNIKLQEDSAEVLSNSEAYALYKELCDNKDFENKTVIAIFGAVLSGVTAGASAYIAAGVIAGTTTMSLAINTSPENIDYQELLGGEYTVSNFVLDGDFDLPQGGGNRFVYSGIVVHGEPIILENGEVIDNPLNMILIHLDEAH